jgi:hypothetical protein
MTRIWRKWYLMKLNLCPNNSQSLRTSWRFLFIHFIVLRIGIVSYNIFVILHQEYANFTWKLVYVIVNINQAILNQPQMWNIIWNVKTRHRNFDTLSMFSSYGLSFLLAITSFCFAFFKNHAKNLPSFDCTLFCL